MITHSYLPPFAQQEFTFDGAHCFSNSDHAFLISKDGSTIIVTKELYQSILSKIVSEDLAIKLFQRGFGTIYGHKRFQDQAEELPALFMIDFTTKCNCNCVYCLRHFEDMGESVSPEMLRQITQYIIDYGKKYHIGKISFQPWGGEPLIEIDQIIACKRQFEQAGIQAHFNIQTNGLLLTLENYEKLRRYHIDIGVSLDGVASVHDKHRVDLHGVKTHQRIVSNLKAILARYPDARIGSLSVNSSFSVNYVEQDVDYLVNEVGLHNIKFNLVHPSGSDGFDPAILIAAEQLNVFVEKLLAAVVQQVELGNACQEANIFDKLNNLIDRSGNNICNTRGCRGGTSFISFDQHGNIFPCEMIGRSEYCLGTIFDEEKDLPTLIRKAKEKNAYYAPRQTESCGDCPFFSYCQGGCKASCLAYGLEPCQVDRIECAINKSLYPRLIDLILERPHTVELLLDRRMALM